MARVLHIGVANDLLRRVREQKERKVPGFIARYGVAEQGLLDTFGALDEWYSNSFTLSLAKGSLCHLTPNAGRKAPPLKAFLIEGRLKFKTNAELRAEDS